MKTLGMLDYIMFKTNKGFDVGAVIGLGLLVALQYTTTGTIITKQKELLKWSSFC